MFPFDDVIMVEPHYSNAEHALESHDYLDKYIHIAFISCTYFKVFTTWNGNLLTSHFCYNTEVDLYITVCVSGVPRELKHYVHNTSSR